MNGMITIENLTGRHLQFRVDHQAVCVKTGKCLCRQGRRSVEAMTVHVPGFGRSAPQHPAVASTPKIKEAASGPRPTIKIHGAAPQEKAKDQKGSTGSGSKGGTGRKGQNKNGRKTK